MAYVLDDTSNIHAIEKGTFVPEKSKLNLGWIFGLGVSGIAGYFLR